MSDADTLARVLHALPDRPAVRIEQPRWAFVNRRDDGSVDFISPVPCPYNYGCVPERMSGDGDALDAMVLGRRLACGTVVHVPVVAVVDFLDGGLADPKVVCSERGLTAGDRRGLEAFFTVYAVFKRGLAAMRGQSTEVRFRGWVPERVWRGG